MTEKSWKKTSISVPVDLLEEFDRVVQRNGYSRSTVFAQMMRQYIEAEAKKDILLKKLEDPDVMAQFIKQCGLTPDQIEKLGGGM